MGLRHNLDTSIFQTLTTTQTNPAAGADFVFTVNADQRIHVVSIDFQLITDATAANRNVRVKFSDGTNDFSFCGHTTNITASLTRQLHFSTAYSASEQESASGDYHIQLPPDLYLNPGDTLESDVFNIQATDAITAIVIRLHRWVSAAL